MSSSTQASFFWMKYGFDNITPLKMYNANVSCAILRSFVKNTCARDVEDVCKQKYIQLGIELDSLNRALQVAQVRDAATTSATDRSSDGGTSSRPASGATSSRPITPSMHADFNESADESIAEIVSKKSATEYQLQVVAAASKLAKELVAGTAIVDLADDLGTRLKLDEMGDARANSILKSRAQYTAVAVTVDDKGSPHVVPLVFKLHKPSADAPPSRPSSGAAKATGTTAPK
ncbi:uncharacterized protein PITG_07329 [Phytophthora infestans T30-4]|uniref:Uncharacterized protein n=2 Tax=Phytophthora infestans TaxID=4787 RepID=D0N7U1_PHYIT|nr:uncharacterized protein PITG_07329 [Phytophthora infestans T30-4]EEY53640.1 conserved hypothetical protein [Phytophthora infestans T30-4]KAF4037110.1 hypothetical protein GN244_ATG10811 [Phytophthora infestans]KAF4146910.1 hypothetical protein GN958_ATG03897 [Phytophthora infestans]KAI9999101.1 hypothetical protein PInf_003787 [Phytophthora infestans]|eukprot:XP_002905258.1 conserved hypothetical protein [Phytophthora infestans T30-4]